MTKRSKSLTSVLITAITLQAFCTTSRLHLLKASAGMADTQNLDFARYDNTELEKGKFDEAEGGAKIKDDIFEDEEAKTEVHVHKPWNPICLANILYKEAATEKKLLRYFCNILEHNNPDAIPMMKRAGNHHKPEGKIRLL